MKEAENAVMYTDMSETEFIKWNLEYTAPLVAGVLAGIADGDLWRRPHANVDPPGWMFGCFANEENRTVAFLRDERVEIPNSLQVFGGCPSFARSMPEDEGAQIERIDLGTDDLLSYMKGVRARTNQYLDEIEDGELKDVPERATEENDPIREEFVKLIWMQNFLFGKLVIAAQLLAGEEKKVERPAFTASGNLWADIDVETIWGRP